MRHTMQKTGRLLAALALSGVLLASGLMAQAAPAPQPGSKGLELEVTEMDLEITEEDHMTQKSLAPRLTRRPAGTSTAWWSRRQTA